MEDLQKMVEVAMPLTQYNKMINAQELVVERLENDEWFTDSEVTMILEAFE